MQQKVQSAVFLVSPKNYNSLLRVSSGYFSQELTITGTHGQLSLRNANLFGRKSLYNNESLCGEEVLYLDTNNKNQTSKINQDQSCLDPDESNCIPQVYLQGYAMLFDQLHLDLKSRDKNSCNLDRKLATFEDALHVSEIFDAARHSFMEKSWMRIGSCSLNGGGNGNSGIAFEK